MESLILKKNWHFRNEPEERYLPCRSPCPVIQDGTGQDIRILLGRKSRHVIISALARWKLIG